MPDILSRSRQRRDSMMNKYGGKYGRGKELTPAEQELVPYIQEQTAVKTDERQDRSVLSVVFDILNTANYASAGLVNEVWKAIDEKKPFPEWVSKGIQGAWDGLTWEKKKTYSDVLRERLSPETIAANEKKGLKIGSFETGITPVDFAGFIGDVLLDPTTYMGLGATNAARSAAKGAALDTVKVWVKEYGKEGFEKLLKDTPDDIAKQARKLFEKGASDKAIEALSKTHAPIGRQIAQVYDDAYKAALKGRGAAVQGDLLSRAEKLTDTFEPAAALPGRDKIADLLSSDTGLGGLINKLKTGTPYESLGERGASFMGMEFAKSVRDPNIVSKSMDAVGKYLKSTPAGKWYSDAWWAINHTGPLGSIREKLGIRNPYEKAINAIKQNDAPAANALMADIMLPVKKALDGVTEPDKKAIDKVYQVAEQLQRTGGSGVSVHAWDIIKDPKKYGIEVGDVQKVRDAISGIERFNRKNMTTLKRLELEGLIDAPEELTAYIRSLYPQAAPRSRPTNFGATPNIAQHRQVARGEAIDQAVEKFKFLYGLDDVQARELVEGMNLGGFSTDLEESLIARAVIQSKIEAKAGMKRQLRDFGIPISELTEGAPWAKNMQLQDIPEAGLFTVGDKAFEGYYFTKQVKDIIDNFNQAADPNSGILKALTTWTSWWKGTALLGPHTKIRNFIDNNFTGYLVNGAKWFDLRYDMEAVAMTVYAARKTNPKTILKEFGMTPGVWNRILSKPAYTDASGKVWTNKDMADIARRLGAFSERTMGYDLAETMGKFQGKDKTNLVFKASHAVDEIVENTMRMKNFKMQFDSIMEGATSGASMKQAVDYASQKTKQMFVDYSDLTDFERKVMKNIIPFYSFIRHNLAAKLHAIVAMPDTFSIFPKLQELAQIEDPDYDPNLIPEYMKNLGMFPAIRMQDGTLGMFNTGLSVQDFNRIPLVFEKGHMLPKWSWEEFKDDLLSSAHPILKTFVEMVPEKGYDTFRKRDLLETSKAPYTFRLLARVPHLVPVLDSVLRWAGFENGLRAKINDDGQFEMDGKMARVLESNLPILRHIDMLLMGGTAIGEELMPGFEAAIEGATGAKSDYEGLEKFFAILSYYTGAKFKPIDMAKMKEMLKKDIYFSAKERRAGDIKDTEAARQRSTQYQERQNQTIRRLVR